jgi:hypothetical protein
LFKGRKMNLGKGLLKARDFSQAENWSSSPPVETWPSSISVLAEPQAAAITKTPRRVKKAKVFHIDKIPRNMSIPPANSETDALV